MEGQGHRSAELALWAPLWLGLGIGLYFALPAEPDRAIWAALAATVLAAAWGFARMSEHWRAPLWAIALCGAGAGLAGLEVARVEAPVLGFRYYGPVEGRIVAIDRSASDATRLTLDRVRLGDLRPARTPERVRISLHGDQPITDWAPGARVMLTAHLSPPSGPAEPGGFDFRRHAWFQRIGAVGYSRTPALRAGEAETDAGVWLFGQRMRLSQAVRDRLPGERGAVAAAILVGDRSGLDAPTLDALRASNLAHLLAISGLHMGLLTGLAFGAVRLALALVPPLALRLPTKKVAAIAGLTAGAAYLALSGGGVATQRAFVMVAVMLTAVLLDRRALTLRAVALAAIIVLVLQPDALVGPGFQMSFAATTALVTVFGALRGRSFGPTWAKPVIAVVLSSFIAGAATAPISAAHFNQVSHYGLIANVASVPVMGAVVMPAALVSAALVPFGLEGVGLCVMGQGLGWILWVARMVSGWEGALSHVPAPPAATLPIVAVGALWFILRFDRWRWMGPAAVAGAIGLWAGAERPQMLIADTGGLIGVMTPDGRALSRATGNGFVADIWLENDGRQVPQATAAARPGFDDAGALVRTRLGDLHLLQIRGTRARDALDGCGGADLLVMTVEDTVDRPCPVLDLAVLRRTGSISLSVAGGGVDLRSATTEAGDRPWTTDHAAAQRLVAERRHQLTLTRSERDLDTAFATAASLATVAIPRP